MNSSVPVSLATPKRPVSFLRRAFFALFIACVGATFTGCAEFMQAAFVGIAYDETYSAVERWSTASENAETLNGVYRAYVNFRNDLGAIDVSDCPQDFQAAFYRLIEAVDYAIETLESLSGSTGFDGALEGLATALFDDPDAHIRDALVELELIAQKYCE